MSAEGLRSFVDTNVLVYAHDTTAGRKLDRARRLVGDLWDSREGCVSVQVLQELFVTLTRRIAAPLDSTTVATVVADYAKWTTHDSGSADVLAAIELRERDGISFWDSMIVQSAASLACDRLYTEDLNAGQRYGGVLVVNPFAEIP